MESAHVLPCSCVPKVTGGWMGDGCWMIEDELYGINGCPIIIKYGLHPTI